VTTVSIEPLDRRFFLLKELWFGFFHGLRFV
jgi:hypothetical protein